MGCGASRAPRLLHRQKSPPPTERDCQPPCTPPFHYTEPCPAVRPAAAAGGEGGSTAPAGGGAADPGAGGGQSGGRGTRTGGGAVDCGVSSGSGGGGAEPGSEVSGGGSGAGGAAPPQSASLRILAAGGNQYGQCGVRQTDPLTEEWMYQFVPANKSPVIAAGLQPPQGAEIRKITCGHEFVLVLTAQGAVLHAGANKRGQRGIGCTDHDVHDELRPVPLPCPAVDIACGAEHAAAALSSGAAYTWGMSKFGQLGRDGEEDGSLGRRTAPSGGGRLPREEDGSLAAAEGMAEVERVYAGSYCTFFLSRGREVAACGSNGCGQLCLGHATEARVGRPQRVAALCGRRILQLQGGERHCIMLEADGSVWVWGGVKGPDDRGRLADGSSYWSAKRGCVPKRLDAGPALCVAAGGKTCAIVTTADQALLAWGGSFGAQPSPLQLPWGQATAVMLSRSETLWALSTRGEWAARGLGTAGLPFGSAELYSELRPIAEAGLSACVPICGPTSNFAVYLEGRGAEEIWRNSVGALASGILRVSGRELREEDFGTPLSDVGASAECVVQLLRVPALPPAAGGGGSPGALCIYVDASLFGETDYMCVEVHSDATVLDLVAAAAAQLQLGA